MAINRVEIKDFLVFNGEFSADFCPGANVLIGGNGTGKTTLLKGLYAARMYPNSRVENNDDKNNMRYYDFVEINTETFGMAVYIPEKDILEHAKGLLTFIEQKQTGFSQVYKDVLIIAQDVPTQEQTEAQRIVGEKINSIIGGKVEWVSNEGTYYTVRTDGLRIPFANEASGYKKLGFLGLLVSNGQLRPGSVLFWDEPENSLNPELVPKVVNILLELAKNGVQIFIATHDYNLARYFDVRKNKDIPVTFHNLSKSDNGQIICDSSPEYLKLSSNLLESANEDLFKTVVNAGFEVWEGDDEQH